MSFPRFHIIRQERWTTREPTHQGEFSGSGLLGIERQRRIMQIIAAGVYALMAGSQVGLGVYSLSNNPTAAAHFGLAAYTLAFAIIFSVMLLRDHLKEGLR